MRVEEEREIGELNGRVRGEGCTISQIIPAPVACLPQAGGISVSEFRSILFKEMPE